MKNNVEEFTEETSFLLIILPGQNRKVEVKNFVSMVEYQELK